MCTVCIRRRATVGPSQCRVVCEYCVYCVVSAVTLRWWGPHVILFRGDVTSSRRQAIFPGQVDLSALRIHLNSCISAPLTSRGGGDV